MKCETRKSVRAVWLAPLAALFLVSAVAQAQTSPSAAPTASVIEVKMAMRKLWEEHITDTRNYIISASADLPDGDAIAGRLRPKSSRQPRPVTRSHLRMRRQNGRLTARRSLRS